MKVLLIYPDRYFGKKGRRVPPILVPPLNLLTLGALTPPEVEVRLIDERVEDINFDIDVDLVGITALTADAIRAYEIADEFRSRGVKVVMGGIHPTVMPEEARQHADCVVVGEAEEIWPQLLEDFKENRMKEMYIPAKFPDLSLTPPQRRDLLRPNIRYINLLQTTRGCPYNCSFCSVSQVFGRKVRTRSLESIEKEVSSFPGKSMYIVDDNILAIPSFSSRLFSLLKGLNKKWLAQASINLLDKFDHLLAEAKKAGCEGFFVGFESISPQNLKKISKTHNLVRRYKEVIKKVHDLGMAIIGSFMFGFDEDDDSVFYRTLEFVKKAKIDLASFTLLTPLPGTRLFKEMEKERRIITRDWSKYDCAHVVFKPLKISAEKLQEGLYWMYREFYRMGEIIKRIIRGFRYMHLLFPLNLAYRIVGKRGYADFQPKKDTVKKFCEEQES